MRIFPRFRPLLAVLLAWPALLAAEERVPAAPPAAVVVSSVENMYTGPDSGKDVTSQAWIGQVVDVLERRDGFALIRTPDAYQGWIAQAALRAYAPGEARRYAQDGARLEVTSLLANLYREPSVTSARPKAQAPLAARLERAPASTKAGWFAVRLPDGETAFVQAGDVRDLGAEAAAGVKGDEVVATARRFLGLPYLWGGMTAQGLDCSGLMAASYRAHGVVLPRDADLQFDDPRARPVEKADLRAGDMLFFGQKKVTHVGMYVGGGVFVHATTHERPVVQESRLDDPYWTGLFRGARRRLP